MISVAFDPAVTSMTATQSESDWSLYGMCLFVKWKRREYGLIAVWLESRRAGGWYPGADRLD